MTRFARLAPLLLLPLLAACATAQREQAEGQAQRQLLLQRLPAEINGFALQPPPASVVTENGSHLRYRHGADGPSIGVSLIGTSGTAPEGAQSPPAQLLLSLIATQAFAQAGSLPGATAERGPDFTVRRHGEAALLAGCADLRLHQQGRLLRDLSCTAVIEKQMLVVKLVAIHGPEQVDRVREVMGRFTGRVVETLRQLPPLENAAPPPPPPAGSAPPPDMLRRLHRT
ncbi:hypothetical protein [Pseudoroseomonas cervicalis]|uniref:hypothetical protein n=1 Tax=Teichococcus cervicalis TaxID=204525 RepID=UPI0022F1A4FE|nr:hypothetical protein [Pseudoroseomonas cervicalis]WBV42007.1 hypothetical protein PFY06_12245 [Pseudoroseomonas cervicalis]